MPRGHRGFGGPRPFAPRPWRPWRRRGWGCFPWFFLLGLLVVAAVLVLG